MTRRKTPSNSRLPADPLAWVEPVAADPVSGPGLSGMGSPLSLNLKTAAAAFRIPEKRTSACLHAFAGPHPEDGRRLRA